MRSSALRRGQQLFRAHEISNRSFATSTQRALPLLPIICRSCSRMLLPQAANRNRPQRRYQSNTTETPFEASSSSPRSQAPQTHYEIFPKTLPDGPPPSSSFTIDARALRKEFLQLQAAFHPDKHASHQKTRAEATSARINEAYKTLLNPLLRAQYLLSLRGIDVAEDETAKVEDPALLMEVLEAREEIEDAQEEGELEGLRKRNDERIEESERVLGEAFKADDMERAKGEAVRLRYWVNIKESLDAWEKGKPVVLVH